MKNGFEGFNAELKEEVERRQTQVMKEGVSCEDA
jgi:hypothetical protein